MWVYFIWWLREEGGIIGECLGKNKEFATNPIIYSFHIFLIGFQIIIQPAFTPLGRITQFTAKTLTTIHSFSKTLADTVHRHIYSWVGPLRRVPWRFQSRVWRNCCIVWSYYSISKLKALHYWNCLVLVYEELEYHNRI